jgi:cytochrome c biogenesis protein CcmG/thiol:disulfide interchange protein DsbE
MTSRLDVIKTGDSHDAIAETKRYKPGLSTLLPLSAFILIAVLLGVGLFMDPRLVPSPLIGKPVPEFSLQAVQGRNYGLTREDLIGEVSMVNVFASWCVACRQEHPLLMELSRQDVVPIHGLNYKDKPQEAADWLDALGDPYTRTGADTDGRVGIDWGVYGVPETFIVDQSGRIAYKHIGPIARKDWEETLKPLIDDLRNRKVKALVTENN